MLDASCVRGKDAFHNDVTNNLADFLAVWPIDSCRAFDMTATNALRRFINWQHNVKHGAMRFVRSCP